VGSALVAVFAAVACLAPAPSRAQGRVVAYVAAENATANVAVPRPDGGYIILASSGMPTRSQIVATFRDGTIERKLFFVSPTNPTMTTLQPSRDGGGLLVGRAASDGTANPVDALVMRIDDLLGIDWKLTWGVTNVNEVVTFAAELSDGGWLVGGTSGHLIRLTALGEVTWAKVCLSPPDLVVLQGLLPLGGDRFVVWGTLQGATFADNELLLAEVEPDGRVRRPRLLDTPGSAYAHDAVRAADGTITLLAETQVGGTSVAWLVRLDPSGAVEWSRASTSPVIVRDLAQDTAGGALVAMDVGSATSGVDMALVRVAPDGVLDWSVALGTARDDRPRTILRSPGGIVVLGTTSGIDPAGLSTPWLLELDARGRPDPSCGLDRSLALALADVAWTAPPAPSLTVTDVPGVDTGLGVWPLSASFSTIETCAAPPGPPGEVSPPGAPVPLRVDARERLSWEDGGASGSETFDVFRGAVAQLETGASAACWRTGLTLPDAMDAELPGPGNAWFYLVAGRNPQGRGTLGADSSGLERLPLTACP
jgi:hypothetical protein